MKILQAHNFYQQPGGEDEVCAAEYQLLTERSQRVVRYQVHNDAITDMSAVDAAVRTIWNQKSYRELQELIRAERPDVVHAHNTFPLISPALYYAAATEGVPVIQTLHNYRLLCPAATLFRDGHICQECVGKAIPYPAVLHACYRKSRSASGVAASMLVTHRLAQTWTTKVQTFVALTNFSKAKFIESGLPADKIVVKPNCVPGHPEQGDGSGGYALFAGRLTEEKGLRTLLAAWDHLGARIPLKIAGEGPLAPWLEGQLRGRQDVEWLGQCDRPAMAELLQKAAFVVFPSEHYENLPMVIIEAFAHGTPVVAALLGSIGELVQDGVNGVHFAPADAAELTRRVETLLMNPDRLRAMRAAARLTYEERYSGERNYILLMELYNTAVLTYKKARERVEVRIEA